VWAAAFAALDLTIGLALLDAMLWGSVRLPSISSPWRSETTLFAESGSLLSAVSLLAINGLVIPLAEEWLWRGLIQPRFIDGVGLAAGLIVTAVLFSLKHVVIDASLGRLLALTAFGLIMGVLAVRHGWRASSLAHMIANTFATALSLSAGFLTG
jgi:membrane protease YdiL (CAAX protease family)